MELDTGKRTLETKPFFCIGNFIDTFRGLGYDNNRTKEKWNGAMERCVEEHFDYGRNSGGSLRIYPAA